MTGTGFLVVDGVEPTLTLNGAAVAATVGGCAPLDYPGHEAQACTTLTTLIPQGSLPQGAVEVAVSRSRPLRPRGGGCSSCRAHHRQHRAHRGLRGRCGHLHDPGQRLHAGGPGLRRRRGRHRRALHRRDHPGGHLR
ncbi:MAG: hypothetical protein R3F43_15395 [bacterium]